MRITNKIIQNNSIANINTNKLLQDKLNTQITTQSKIVRPSDDPVVAIRALRLRTNLTEITQYYEKNIPDAKNWLSITEESLLTMSKVVTEMYKNCEKGAQGGLKAEDRLKILEDLKGLADEVYATGDADCAGKNIFTGYRTNVRLSFQAPTDIPYTITEQLTKDAIDSITYVDIRDLKDLNSGNFGDTNVDTEEGKITGEPISRIRLSYDKNSNKVPELNVKTGVNADGSNTYIPLQVGGANVVISSVSKTADPNPYELAKQNPDKAYFVPETGELLLGKDVNDAMQQLPKNQEIAVTYEKNNWEKGDLRPEHYFAATANQGVAGKEIKYNQELLTDKKNTDLAQQIISYDVGFNQEMRVNTLAGECFTHNIGRDVDELVAITQEVLEMDTIVKDLESMLKSDKYTPAEKEQIQSRLNAANRANTLLTAKCQKMFENGMTKMQGHLDQTTLATTNVGSRSARLTMVEGRLKSQQTSFKELTSENEGADVTELAIQLKSAKLSYDAALMATGQIVQNSLMNFI